MADIPQRLYKAMKWHTFGLHGHTSPGDVPILIAPASLWM